MAPKLALGRMVPIGTKLALGRMGARAPKLEITWAKVNQLAHLGKIVTNVTLCKMTPIGVKLDVL